MSQQETRLHLDILDEQRRTLWLRLKPLASRFYLARGTALALQKGHRDSVDFDFYTSDKFDPLRLRGDMDPVFAGCAVTVTQAAPNTLSLLVDDTIRLRFFSYAYMLVQPLVQTSSVSLASMIDIGCMKLSAIVGRSTLKDYVDLFVILNEIPLERLLEAARQKFPELDTNVVLKALACFADIEDEPVDFTPEFAASRPELEHFISEAVRRVLTATLRY